jgi:hypothetical protein
MKAGRRQPAAEAQSLGNKSENFPIWNEEINAF